jgi:RNA polymerase sigma factor (sigma-70 family)
LKVINQKKHTEDSDDALLWQAFKRGERSAFETLLQQYYPMLLNYGVRFYRDKEFVKDSVHDLFVEIWNRREHLSDVVSVKSYLLQALRKNIIRESGRLKWFREADEISEKLNFDVEFNIETHFISREIETETLQKLQMELDKLTKRQREAIFLRFTQDLPYEEIASIMAINYRSVINLIHEAIKSIRQNWFLLLLPSFLYFS